MNAALEILIDKFRLRLAELDGEVSRCALLGELYAEREYRTRLVQCREDYVLIVSASIEDLKAQRDAYAKHVVG